MAGTLHGKVVARSLDPTIATVVGSNRLETELDIELAGHAAGTARIEVRIGLRKDQFELRFEEVEGIELSCYRSDQTAHYFGWPLPGVVVGQRAACSLVPIQSSLGPQLQSSFIDVEPDPHLQITRHLGNGQLEIKGLRAGPANLRVRSGTRLIEVPFSVVAEDEPVIGRLWSHMSPVTEGKPIELRLKESLALRLQIATPDGRAAQPMRAPLYVEDSRLATALPVGDIERGYFELTGLAPGFTTLIWQLGEHRYQWPVVVIAPSDDAYVGSEARQIAAVLAASDDMQPLIDVIGAKLREEADAIVVRPSCEYFRKATIRKNPETGKPSSIALTMAEPLREGVLSHQFGGCYPDASQQQYLYCNRLTLPGGVTLALTVLLRQRGVSCIDCGTISVITLRRP